MSSSKRTDSLSRRTSGWDTIDFIGTGTNCWRGLMSDMATAHGHSELEANLLEHGRASYELASQGFELERGRFTLFSGLRPHRLASHERAHCHWFTLPLATLLQWNLAPPFVSALLAGEPLVDRESAADEDLARFRRWESDWRSGEPSLRRAALLEFRARLERMTCSPSVQAQCARSGVRPAHSAQGLDVLERIVIYASEHFREGITVGTVAAAVRVHPHYASHVLHQHMGISLKQFITRLRLDHAARLLADSDRPILDISQDSGFSTLSRFYESFTNRFGKPPGEWRSLR